MKTQTFTPSSKNAGALGGKSYPLSPVVRLEEAETDIRSWVIKLIAFDSADKLDHTSGGLVVPCSWGHSGEGMYLLEETLGGTHPEDLTCTMGDSRGKSADLPVCSQVGSTLGRAQALRALCVLTWQAGSGCRPSMQEAGLQWSSFALQMERPTKIHILERKER